MPCTTSHNERISTQCFDEDGNELFLNDAVRFLGQTGTVTFECGAFGIGFETQIDWDEVEKHLLPGNHLCACLNDNFISLWEIFWNLNGEDNCMPGVFKIAKEKETCAMFKPTDAQITEFLDEYLIQYELKDIERVEGDEDDIILVTVEIMLRCLPTVTPAGQTEPACKAADTTISVSETLEFSRERLITNQLPSQPVLYNKWLAANGWHYLFQNNPFTEKKENTHDSD